MKKALVMLLFFTLLASAVFAEGTSESSKSESKIVPNGLDEYGMFDPPIDVSTVGRYSPDDGLGKMPKGTNPDNWAYIEIMKKWYGINISYKWTAPSDQYETKLNLTFASSDMPDTMELPNFLHYERFVQTGNAADLKPWMKYLTKEVLADYEQYPELLALTTFGDEVLGIAGGGNIENYVPVIFVRKDWMDKLGYDAPTDWNQLLDMAEAFAKQDPDGNGKDDTTGIGITKDVGTRADYTLWGIAEAYHSYPNRWILLPNGELGWGSVQPETRTALLAAQDMYKRGIFDEEFITIDDGKLGEQLAAGTVGVWISGWWAGFYLGPTRTNVPGADFLALPLLSADSKPARVGVKTIPYGGEMFVAAKTAEHPEALIWMINHYVDHMIYGEAKYGDLTYEENGFTWNWLPIKYWKANAMLHNATVMQDAWNNKDPDSIQEPAVRSMYDSFLPYLEEGDLAPWGGYYSRMAEEGPWGVIRNDYIANDKYFANVFYGNPGPMQSEWEPGYHSKFVEVAAKIVMGDSITLFDDFVSEYMNGPGGEITEEVNALYDEFMSR